MRDRVLDAAERMVQDRGLSGVSFQQLADAVGLSKPSVFHHFANKAALAGALVERCEANYNEQYAPVLESDRIAPEKLRGIAKVFEQELRAGRLCLLGSLAQSASSLADPVQADLQASIARTIQAYARVFEQGATEGSLEYEGKPADAAAVFLAMLEGLQVLARAKQDHAMLRRASQSYIDSLAREHDP